MISVVGVKKKRNEITLLYTVINFEHMVETFIVNNQHRCV